MRTVVERIDKALPKKVEKMFTAFDLTKAFFAGLGTAVLLIKLVQVAF